MWYGNFVSYFQFCLDGQRQNPAEPYAWSILSQFFLFCWWNWKLWMEVLIFLNSVDGIGKLRMEVCILSQICPFCQRNWKTLDGSSYVPDDARICSMFREASNICHLLEVDQIFQCLVVEFLDLVKGIWNKWVACQDTDIPGGVFRLQMGQDLSRNTAVMWGDDLGTIVVVHLQQVIKQTSCLGCL